MINQNGKVFLIEANTNPCLEMSSPLLARLIPVVLENAFKLKYKIFIIKKFKELQLIRYSHHLNFHYGLR